MRIMTDLTQIALWVRATQKNDFGRTVLFSNVSTDTRTLQAGDLFIALKGERFDAHEFLVQIKNGQVAAVMAESVPEGFNVPSVIVENTRTSLLMLAANWRKQFEIPLAVVTGSNGKTTVKEMLASILNVAFSGSYLATKGNLNNDIGVPMTLLNLRAHHKAAVIELGVNHSGETRHLAPIVAPTVAIINNAQREHQEFMHTVEAVAAEHADVLESLPKNGTAVFSADDAHSLVWRTRSASLGLEVNDFSLNEAAGAAFTARYELGLHASTVQIMTPKGQCTTQLNIPGEHNVHNALAACAAACAMNIPLDVIALGLANFLPAKGRLQTHRLNNGVTLIDDTYNANPDSVRAAIDVLAGGEGKKILVLGDMGEVGTQGVAYHQEVGAYAASCGISIFVGVGDLMAHAVKDFGTAGQYCQSVADVSAIVQEHITGGAHTVLVKGSRFMGMECVVNDLIDASKTSLNG